MDWFVASTFPSLLSPSPSFTALGSVQDLDTPTSMADCDTSLSDCDTSIVGAFPSLFSSPSFTALGAALDASYDDGVARVRRTRFSEVVEVLVFEKEESFYDDSVYEQFATDDSNASFELDTSIFGVFPSLLSPSNSFSELGSVLDFDLDTLLCVAPVFSYTVTLVDDGDSLPTINTAVVATFPSLLSPSSCYSISSSLLDSSLDTPPCVVQSTSSNTVASVDDGDGEFSHLLLF
ncbi:hypothetical protein M405DRAFT_524519 [Rhizopogon salebrosus TDB-379]|nr:hypothetical protein M405DRAFT_524519 [Rhizopogon salebrosus TDB-379]